LSVEARAARRLFPPFIPCAAHVACQRVSAATKAARGYSVSQVKYWGQTPFFQDKSIPLINKQE